jgi:C2 domain
LFTLPVDLNPEWDQIIYTPVHSLRETLLLEVMDYQNLTKDRSLGTVELKVSELAQGAGGDSHYLFESRGKKDKSEPIRLDRGNQYKGQLHYLAEFLPAYALQGLTFETGPNEPQSTMVGRVDGDDVEDSRGQVVVRTPTTTEPIGTSKNHKKHQQSVDSTATVTSTDTTEVPKAVGSREGSPASEKTRERQENEGVKMSKDELLGHRR